MNMKALKKDGDRVLEFKKLITKEFFKMRKQLLQIKLNQQNKEWIERRQKGKKSRKELTQAIKELLNEHVKNNPDSNYAKNPNLLYTNITKMINNSLFDIQIETKNKRDYMTKDQLSFLEVAEIKMQEIIHKCIDDNKNAKKTYQILKTEIKPYVEWLGKTPVIDLLTNNRPKNTKQIGDD